MIDEERTMRHFGYTSDSLSHGSGKLIMVECDMCGVVMERKMSTYNTVEHPDLCYSCIRVELYGDINSVVRIPPDKVDEASKEYNRQQTKRREEISAKKQGIWNYEKCRRYTDEEILNWRKDLYMNPVKRGFPEYGDEEFVAHQRHETSIDENKSIDWVATYKRFGYTYTDTPHYVVICASCGERRTTISPARNTLCMLCRAGEWEVQWLNGWMNKVDKNEGDILTRYKKGWVDIPSEANLLGTTECGLRSRLIRLCGKLPKDIVYQRLSAGLQGIPYEEWTEYATPQKYCSKFNESLKCKIREKYDNKCFLCGKPQSDNITTAGKQKALSVHHIDYNKDQGCNDHEWHLVPLCMEHHARAHNDMWQARIEYLLDNVWV